MKFRKLKIKKGFTLIEVIIAMGIFSIASVVISSVYLNASNLHQHTVNFQRLQNEGRYMMEKMVREIRAREIDYTAIDPAESQNYIKFIGDEFGSVVEMIWDGSNISYSVTTPSTGALSANLNADDIEVVDLKFYIIPDAENTWGSDPDPIINIQPRVIIFLKLKNKSINPNFQKEILLQTTVSSKVYKR